MKCQHCKAELSKGMKYCPRCGAMDDYAGTNRPSWERTENMVQNIFFDGEFTSIGCFVFWLAEASNITIPASVSELGL